MSVEQIKTKIWLLIYNDILTECACADIGGVLSICTYVGIHCMHVCIGQSMRLQCVCTMSRVDR